jgi:hypothetical protein
MAPTVTAAVTTEVSAAYDWHCTEVEDDHIDVAHDARDSAAVVDKSKLPKLRPDTVTEAIPLIGALICAVDATAAS